MVAGMESFIQRFRDYSDCYTIIGGAACDILMTEAETEFRATRDIDMIVIMEARYQEFTKVFWEYINEGGYRFGWKNSDKAHFYRFTEPKPGYPAMIELFSREPKYIKEVPAGIIPLYIDDDTSSLSAILLDDDYYNFMLSGRKTVSGASVLDAEHLIPFKMYAWLDLKDKKQRGEHVNERDLKKHKYDVFRLLQITDRTINLGVSGLVKGCIEMNDAYHIQKYIPDSLAIGDDECSNAVIYANGEKGPGLYIVPFNDLEADSMIYIAGSLRDFLVDGVGLDVFNCVV